MNDELLADIARETHTLRNKVDRVLRQCSMEAHELRPAIQVAFDVLLRQDDLRSRFSSSVAIPSSEYFVFDHSNNAYVDFEAFDYTLFAFCQRTVAGTVYHPDVMYRDDSKVFKLLNNAAYGAFDNAAFLDLTYVLEGGAQGSGRRLPVIVYNICEV